LPPLKELLPLLEQIWQSRTLTNDGPYHEKFEQALCSYLGIEHVALVSNATLGLVLALQQSGISGQVITTPFSFVGTSHAIRLAGLEPVFVDIDPQTLNLDPSRIESALTAETSAIMPVHCFGRRCDVDAIDAVAQRHGLRVIYDAAHAFGVQDEGGSILRHGDMSVLSFHATKVFNTFEGGAVICKGAEAKNEIDRLRNFGIVDEVTVTHVGLNAKMNEFSAALGLIQLGHVDQYISRREHIAAYYRELLAPVSGLQCLEPSAEKHPNYYSFPVLVQPNFDASRDELYNHLRGKGIFARRYFHPLISDLPMYCRQPSASADNLPVARSISERILCLPMFPDLTDEQQRHIVETLISV
jgi:dTDP-4-amino-4,6-dideoxygalactose transaminase